MFFFLQTYSFIRNKRALPDSNTNKIGESKNMLDRYIYWSFMISLSVNSADQCHSSNRKRLLNDNEHQQQTKVSSLRRFSLLEQQVWVSARQELCLGIYTASQPKQWAFYKPAGRCGHIQVELFGRILVFLLLCLCGDHDHQLCESCTQWLKTAARTSEDWMLLF